MRLIDADELKQLILCERDKIPLELPAERYGFGVPRRNYHGDSMRGGIRKALRCMEQCPTIDAVPVVHGKWVYIGDDEWYCSNCGYIVSTEGRWEPMMENFCSNCGAKMDLED